MLGKLFAVLFAAIVVIASVVVTSIGAAAQTPIKIAFIGDLGVNSAFTHKGLFFIPSGVGTIPNHADDANRIAYITDQLAKSSAPMGICSWHKDQRDIQVASKSDGVGGDPYEARRQSGAIVATGHEHSYSWTQLPGYFETKSVADTSDTFAIEKGHASAHYSSASCAT